LSENEIRLRFDKEIRPTEETSLVGYWRINEMSGDTARDVVNNFKGIMTTGMTGVVQCLFIVHIIGAMAVVIIV
jgi:C-terminal processing protease CtpA/Prc